MDDYSISLIVREVCQAIFKNLVHKHMPVPSVDDLVEEAELYELLWNFPNVFGALKISLLPKFGVSLWRSAAENNTAE